MSKRVVVISDNVQLCNSLMDSIIEANDGCTKLFSTSNNTLINSKYPFEVIDVKKEYEKLIQISDLIVSIHCKQIFPKNLVRKVRCINVHPGFNPYNRGWFPQVFSLINGLPIGATIHEIDEELDHGFIICQEKIEVYDTDTSFTLYNRIQELEIKLVKENIKNIINNNYNSIRSLEYGNINYYKDFKSLCKININQHGTFLDFYNLLRATTHGDYKNAYFINNKGNKVFLSIKIEEKDENKTD